MRIKKKGIAKFKAKMSIVCAECGAVLEIDARDIKACSKACEKDWYTFECADCKRTNKINKSLISEAIIKEYETDWSFKVSKMIREGLI